MVVVGRRGSRAWREDSRDIVKIDRCVQVHVLSPYSTSPNHIKCGNLKMDASTKQGHQVVVKVVRTLNIVDTVQLKALMTYITDK